MALVGQLEIGVCMKIIILALLGFATNSYAMTTSACHSVDDCKATQSLAQRKVNTLDSRLKVLYLAKKLNIKPSKESLERFFFKDLILQLITRDEVYTDFLYHPRFQDYEDVEFCDSIKACTQLRVELIKLKDSSFFREQQFAYKLGFNDKELTDVITVGDAVENYICQNNTDPSSAPCLAQASEARIQCDKMGMRLPTVKELAWTLNQKGVSLVPAEGFKSYTGSGTGLHYSARTYNRAILNLDPNTKNLWSSSRSNYPNSWQYYFKVENGEIKGVNAYNSYAKAFRNFSCVKDK